jgi:AcrR family transcriptional regulator
MTFERVAPSLRERTRLHVQSEIARQALELFDLQGFDATTIDQIAAAAGISQRSFFRYFPTKEDVVIDDPAAYGAHLAEVLHSRPSDEAPWDALQQTLRVRTAKWRAAPEVASVTLRLLERSSGLRARLLQKSAEWQSLLRPELERRLQGDKSDRRLAAAAMIGAAFSCLDAAFLVWCDDQTADLDRLFDRAIDSVRRS